MAVWKGGARNSTTPGKASADATDNKSDNKKLHPEVEMTEGLMTLPEVEFCIAERQSSVGSVGSVYSLPPPAPSPQHFRFCQLAVFCIYQQ